MRVHCVTGVQTCALPICSPSLRILPPPASIVTGAVIPLRLPVAEESEEMVNESSPAPVDTDSGLRTALMKIRSEERRVGRECRSRRSAENNTKSGYAAQQ